VLRLVSWGSLVRGKGLHVAVQAAELLGSPQRVSIDHFGRVLDSVHARDLQQLARRVRLRLHGAYGEHDMAVAFPAFDLAVFPSLFLETHGMVVDEAMALGLPVVVSDRGAPPARIGARGRVFPPGNAAALAAILQEFLDRPELLLAMRAAAPPPAPTMAEHCAALRGLYEAVSR
jgi:glycosyltransferase involved in cell wall biosynthesis